MATEQKPPQFLEVITSDGQLLKLELQQEGVDYTVTRTKRKTRETLRLKKSVTDCGDCSLGIR